MTQQTNTLSLELGGVAQYALSKTNHRINKPAREEVSTNETTKLTRIVAGLADAIHDYRSDNDKTEISEISEFLKSCICKNKSQDSMVISSDTIKQAKALSESVGNIEHNYNMLMQKSKILSKLVSMLAQYTRTKTHADKSNLISMLNDLSKYTNTKLINAGGIGRFQASDPYTLDTIEEIISNYTQHDRSDTDSLSSSQSGSDKTDISHHTYRSAPSQFSSRLTDHAGQHIKYMQSRHEEDNIGTLKTRITELIDKNESLLQINEELQTDLDRYLEANQIQQHTIDDLNQQIENLEQAQYSEPVMPKSSTSTNYQTAEFTQLQSNMTKLTRDYRALKIEYENKCQELDMAKSNASSSDQALQELRDNVETPIKDILNKIGQLSTDMTTILNNNKNFDQTTKNKLDEIINRLDTIGHASIRQTDASSIIITVQDSQQQNIKISDISTHYGQFN